MADTTKLSVEKALNKLREADAQKSKSTRHEEQMDALDEETKRMRHRDCASKRINDVRASVGENILGSAR